MKITTLRVLVMLFFSCGLLSAQEITTVGGLLQNCQCDTVSVTFEVTQAFTAGNQFSVELSNTSGVFNANFIEVAPLSATAIGTYAIKTYLPCNTPPGNYSVRVVANNPITISSDTLSNFVINELPRTNIVNVAWPGLGAPALSLSPGDSTLLSASDTVGTWSYQWQIKNPINTGAWTNIAGATDAWLKVDHSLINPQDTTNFRVVLNNGACDTLTNVLQVDYSVPLAVKEIQNVNTSTQNCQCDTVDVLFTVIVPLNPGNTFKIEMSNAAGVFNGNFIQTTPLLAFNFGGYSMEAVIPCNTVQGLYKIRVVASDPVTASDPVNNIIVGALPNTEITIYDTYTSGSVQRFCKGDTAYLVGPIPPLGETHQYQWLSSGVPIAGETDDTLVVTNSGIYSVSVTRGLCEATSSDTIVNAYSPPAYIVLNNDPAIKYIGLDSIQMCEGTVGILNAPSSFGTEIYKYQWMIDTLDNFGNPVKYAIEKDTNQTLAVDSAGVYYVQVTSVLGGCIDTSRAFYVFVDTIPQTSIVGLSSLNLCYEDSVILTALDTVAFPDWKYQWQAEFPLGSGIWMDSPVDTLPFIQIDTNKIPNTDTINLRLKTYNVSCEFISNNLQVVFIPDPVFTFFPGDSVAICIEDSIFVSCQGNALSYEWENGELDPGIWVFPSDAPSMWVKAIGKNGCTSFDTLKIGVFQSTATITPSSIEVAPGEYAEFTGTGGINFYWFSNLPADFNDRFTDDVRILPTQDTTMVILEVTGAFGCLDYDTAYIYVVDPDPNPDDKFRDVQNVITPNGDGKNDMLDLTLILESDECALSILDRWGREVYQKEAYDNTWNGTTTAGEKLPDGTYYYILKCGNELRYKGPVTILSNEN